jgi:hypothetical protein
MSPRAGLDMVVKRNSQPPPNLDIDIDNVDKTNVKETGCEVWSELN